MTRDQLTEQLEVHRASVELAKRFTLQSRVDLVQKSAKKQVQEASRPERSVQMGTAKAAVANFIAD